MTKSQGPAPTRRTMLASTFGLGALGTAALAPAAEAALGEPTIPDNPDSTFYLSVSGIPGSVPDGTRAPRIALLTFGWGAKSPVDPLAAAGSGSGKPTPAEVILAARSEIQSPGIIKALNRGTTLGGARIDCVKPGTRPFVYMRLLFERVVVSEYYVTPDSTNGLPTDVVHLKFQKVTSTFFPQKSDGTSGPAVTSSFDYAAKG